MNPIVIASVLLSLLLAACMPNDTDETGTTDQESQTNQLLNLSITGLEYATETQSGTLSNGDYQYIEGETVVISLLGKELAEFDASQGLVLADFPDNEQDLGTAFFDGQGFESFQELANLIQLLANLDNDGVLDNGIDVSSYSGQSLVTTDIDLNVSPDIFYEETLIELANELSTTRSVTPMVSIAYLYDIAEQEMTYYQLDTLVTDTGNDSTVDQSSTYFYSAKGYKEQVSVADDQDIVTNEYVYEYDDMGRLLALRYPKYNSSGSRTFERGYTYVFNLLGQVESKTSYYDYNGDGAPDSASTEHYDYNSKGWLEVETQDRSNGDTVIQTHTYNNDGTVKTIHELEYDDEDVLDSQELITYTYNSAGLVTEKRTDKDIDADDTYDYYDLEIKTYNSNNDVLSSSDATYTSGDDLESESLQVNVYNDSGHQTEYSYWNDYDGDNIVNYRSQETYSLNEEGETTDSLQKVYQDGVTLSSTRRYVFHTPSLGFQGEYTRYDDDDADGSEDSSRYQLTSYDDTGSRISEIINRDDDDNDGTVDSEDLKTYNYDVAINGVGAFLTNVYASRN
ncbi:hypothetical protein P7F88_10270 [Vibrio hannami]|uniref:hypothetical protein n=1 Tax=Vibrio hannami TaxID=2717094 RepID=UPI00240F0D7B|nr:hypothetical protein [Vibrio hannami]MDG3086475.1 hypothetical protein [Vibrio hannami]